MIARIAVLITSSKKGKEQSIELNDLKTFTDYFQGRADKAGSNVVVLSSALTDLVPTTVSDTVMGTRTLYTLIAETGSGVAIGRPAGYATTMGETGIRMRFHDGASRAILSERRDTEIRRRYAAGANLIAVGVAQTLAGRYLNSFQALSYVKNALDKMVRRCHVAHRPTLRDRVRNEVNGFCSVVLMVAAIFGSTSTAYSADDESALSTMLGRDSEVTLQLRSFAMERKKPGPVLNEAWAAGGWLEYQSGWLADTFKFGLVGYTSQPLWAPTDASGTLLLTSTQSGYSVLGQANASLKLLEQTLTGGRFEVDLPEVNPHDSRMTPNTFEGARLSGKFGGVSYLGAYLAGEKTRNSTRFENMATVAGAPDGVSSPMWLIGLSGDPVKDLGVRLSSYHVPDILNSTYADATWRTRLSESYELRLGLQAMYQGSTGSNALTGSSFSTFSGGLKADLIADSATVYFAYQQTGRDAAYRTPYGGWPGYTAMIIQDFDQAGQRAYLLGGTYNFSGLGAPGMVLNAAVVYGHDQITASTGAPLPNLTEYDLNLDYHFTADRWPKWAKPLWIRARAGYLDQGASGHTSDYRIILNYPLVFK